MSILSTCLFDSRVCFAPIFRGKMLLNRIDTKSNSERDEWSYDDVIENERWTTLKHEEMRTGWKSDNNLTHVNALTRDFMKISECKGKKEQEHQFVKENKRFYLLLVFILYINCWLSYTHCLDSVKNRKKTACAIRSV